MPRGLEIPLCISLFFWLGNCAARRAATVSPEHPHGGYLCEQLEPCAPPTPVSSAAPGDGPRDGYAYAFDEAGDLAPENTIRPTHFMHGPIGPRQPLERYQRPATTELE